MRYETWSNGDRDYVIWSNEHRAFWGPNWCGYVELFADAGLYTREQADKILEQSWCPGSYCCHNGTLPHEVALHIIGQSATGMPHYPDDDHARAQL